MKCEDCHATPAFNYFMEDAHGDEEYRWLCEVHGSAWLNDSYDQWASRVLDAS